MSLEQLYQQIEQGESVEAPNGWLQGRTIFGGLVAGILLLEYFSREYGIWPSKKSKTGRFGFWVT